MMAPYMFDLGDVVQLKSGGPLLTILERNEDDAVRYYQIACIMTHGPVVLVVPEQAVQRPQ